MHAWFLAVALSATAAHPQSPSAGPVPALMQAIERHELAWRLSDPDEVRAILGEPRAEDTGRDGGMEVRTWAYGGDDAVYFVRTAGSRAPFVLAGARNGSRRVGPDPGAPLALRTVEDLSRLPAFTGLQNVDASRLDLRGEGPRLRDLPFDSRTLWPRADRLPPGFDPDAILRDGRNPGLGLRALHARGIDGRGVTIGIIDQPLLEHAEYRGRLTEIARLDVDGVGPQMHGPAVASLAGGTSVGAAPGASLAYVAMAMWKSRQSNALYLDALARLLAWRGPGESRVRVVSISDGLFATSALADQWRALLSRAEVEGVLVITCDLAASRLEYGLLKPVPGGDRDTPDGYTTGSYGTGLLVPGDGRAFASSAAPDAFSFAPKGGMSWAPPYLAGLAALGLQVNPDLTPARLRAYLVRSATDARYGRVVNPEAFVRLCREDPDRGR